MYFCGNMQVTKQNTEQRIPVGRFAPSPTGRMHLGNVLTALLSYLSVKSKGGKWILRIEDLDPARCRSEYAKILQDDLHWLGLEWDEGGVEKEEYCQSCRSDIYKLYFNKLKDTGLVYPCWCSRADINAAGAPHQSDGRVIYPGTCRPMHLGGKMISEKESGLLPMPGKTRTPSWRICVPDETICVEDGHFGHIENNLARDCGDFIILRSDAVAAYQLAVVVDDALMGVTEVVRGRDLLLSAVQQQWLYGLLGLKAPSFTHIPLLCARDGRRLCKRDMDMDMGHLRENYSAEQVVGMLAAISGLQKENAPARIEDLAGAFDWDKVPVRDIRLG